MKSWFSYLSLLFILIVCFQSTKVFIYKYTSSTIISSLFFIKAYPSSYPQRPLGYLLCQLSAVSCKRSTTEVDDSIDTNIDESIQMCIALNKPLRLCLDQTLYEKRSFLE
jgi:hypothetical protein